MDTLREKLRVSFGENESPNVGIIDSLNVKTSLHVDKEHGIDDNKKVMGRNISFDGKSWLFINSQPKSENDTFNIIIHHLPEYPPPPLLPPPNDPPEERLEEWLE